MTERLNGRRDRIFALIRFTKKAKRYNLRKKEPAVILLSVRASFAKKRLQTVYSLTHNNINKGCHFFDGGHAPRFCLSAEIRYVGGLSAICPLPERLQAFYPVGQEPLTWCRLMENFVDSQSG
jgi:hypothetical protein